MSKVIATGAILGSHYYVKQAEALVEKAISEKGADFKFEFPDTAYFLPHDVRHDRASRSETARAT